MKIHSKLHKAIRGRVNGESYHVIFDVDGCATVDEAVGVQLLRLSDAVQVNDEPRGLEGKTVTELKAMVSEAGLPTMRNATKAQLIELLVQKEDDK
jgi:hypothetical protein